RDVNPNVIKRASALLVEISLELRNSAGLRLHNDPSFVGSLHSLLCPTPDFGDPQEVVSEIRAIRIWIDQVIESIDAAIGVFVTVLCRCPFIKIGSVIGQEYGLLIPGSLIAFLVEENHVVVVRQLGTSKCFGYCALPNNLVLTSFFAEDLV